MGCHFFHFLRGSPHVKYGRWHLQESSDGDAEGGSDDDGASEQVKLIPEARYCSPFEASVMSLSGVLFFTFYVEALT